MDTELETKIYSELSEHLGQILAEHGSDPQKKWRGIIAINCFKGFLDTALKSEQDNPHEVMAILDHMFVQLVDLYQNAPQLNESNQDEVCAVSSE